MILLLNILIIVAAVAPSYSVTREEKNESVQVLSKLGSRGNEVRQVQTKLKSLGYYTGKVDGIYGTGTQSAVKKIPKKLRHHSRWHCRAENFVISRHYQ